MLRMVHGFQVARGDKRKARDLITPRPRVRDSGASTSETSRWQAPAGGEITYACTDGRKPATETEFQVVCQTQAGQELAKQMYVGIQKLA